MENEITIQMESPRNKTNTEEANFEWEKLTFDISNYDKFVDEIPNDHPKTYTRPIFVCQILSIPENLFPVSCDLQSDGCTGRYLNILFSL